MDNQSGELTYVGPNALGDAFVAPGGSGTIVSSLYVSTLYTLTNVGDLLYLNPNSGIIDTATLPTISATASNIQGITYTPSVAPGFLNDTTTITNDVEIPHQYNFSHNIENDNTFPNHIINANVFIGQPALLPGYNPDVSIYPTLFSIGDLTHPARSITMCSGIGGTTLTSVQGISIDAAEDVNINTLGLLLLDGGVDVAINAGGAMELDAGGLIAITAVGVATMEAGAELNLTSVGAMTLEAGGGLFINSTGETEIGGTNVNVTAGNKQETIAGDNNITCSAFTAELGGCDILAGVMAIEAGAFDLVSLAGFGFQGVGGVSFVTGGNYSFTGSNATFNTNTLGTSNLLVSTINGFPYNPGSSSSNWSQYPATSAVNFAGYTASNIGNCIGTNSQFQTALSGQTLTTALTCYTDAYVGSNLYVSSINAQTTITANTLRANASQISTMNAANIVTNTILTSQLNALPVSQYNNANWASNTALTNVNLGSNNLSNVSVVYGNALNMNFVNTSNVTCSNAIVGATLQISTINGTPYSPSSPPSSWALFPAVSTINMATNGLKNVLDVSYWTNDPAVTDGSDTLFTEVIGADKISASALLETNPLASVNLNGTAKANGYTINPNFNQYYNAANPTIIDISGGKNNSVYWIYTTGSDYDINWNFPLNGNSEYGRYQIMSGLPIGGNNMFINIRIYANTLSGTLLQYDRIQLNPGQICMFETYPFNGGTQATWVTYKVGASGPNSTGIGG